MKYIAELYTQNPVAFIAAAATLLGSVVALLSYLRKSKGDRRPPVGGNPTVTTGSVGGNVIVNTGSGTVGNVSSINFAKEDQRTEWRIYEVAFLWHDQVPPGVQAHFKQMSRDVEETKVLLHRAVESGNLPILRQECYQNGVTRWVGREDLVRFALSRGEKPRFLFPDER